MNPNECLSEELLSRYAVGDLSEAEAGSVDSHLAACRACLDRLDTLTRRPYTLVEALRQPQATAGYEPPALAQAMAAAVEPGRTSIMSNVPALEAGVLLSG